MFVKQEVFKPGELVEVVHSFDLGEIIMPTFGLIIGACEMLFDEEDEVFDEVFDVQVGDMIVQCFADDLMKIEDE